MVQGLGCSPSDARGIRPLIMTSENVSRHCLMSPVGKTAQGENSCCRRKGDGILRDMAHLHVFFGKCLFRSSAHFFTGLCQILQFTIVIHNYNIVTESYIYIYFFFHTVFHYILSSASFLIGFLNVELCKFLYILDSNPLSDI